MRLFSFSNFYKGTAHVMISRKHILEMVNSSKYQLLKLDMIHMTCSDEIFYQTILKNTIDSSELVNNNYLFTDWLGRKGSPKTLSYEDIPRIVRHHFFFARKVEDINLLHEIIKNFLIH